MVHYFTSLLKVSYITVKDVHKVTFQTKYECSSSAV